MSKKKIKNITDKSKAIRKAQEMGCSGAHQHSDGSWMPCSSHEEFIKKTSKKGRSVGSRKKNSEWENLRESPIMGIDGSFPGITSGSFKSANRGPEYVRENDPDVFVDPESARFRSRQLGCVGISRRMSKNGRAVWMPCTNMSDYSRLSGSTHLGRRHQRAETRNAVRTIVNEELRKLKKKS